MDNQRTDQYEQGNENVNGNRATPPESYVPSLPSGTNDSSGTKHSRVTSTVAQTFAADLDSMFGLSTGGNGTSTTSEGSIAEVQVLSQTVEEKKKDVSTGQSELELLEAKLRETEQRLAKVSRQNSPSRQANTGAPRDRLPGEAQQERQPHPFAQKPTYPADRPPTAPRQDTQSMMQGMPGAMPTTPGVGGGGRDDYVMVDDGRGR